MVEIPDSLDQLSAQERRELARELIARVARLDQTITSNAKELLYRQTKIDQLTHEMATLKRMKFGRSREQLDTSQASLLEKAFDEDLAAIKQELHKLTPPAKTDGEPCTQAQARDAASALAPRRRSSRA